MRETWFLVILLIFTACNSKDPATLVQYLDGYWEITKVERDGQIIKEYRFNENIDFFEIDGMQGIRKKVKPQLDGTYLVTNDFEKVEIEIEDSRLILSYTTPYDSGKEKVVEIKENTLVMEKEAGIIYHYQRYQPLIINNYEKE
ncbi:lipocalin family protein [soil metagenome]